MTAPLSGATPCLSAVPATQNTAPVNEFRCLFTNDVRRKQKRWQDGYLKFHTFNNRVMVYDQSRNFLGDTYWKESHELAEGEELQLDKPVMVEVAEAMGITQTDLTPLFDKNKNLPQHSNAPPLPNPLSGPTRPLNKLLRACPQLRHKSLNALLGTPKGPIGKAKPIVSPYQARQEKEKQNQQGEQRPKKRHQADHNAAEQREHSPLVGTEPAPKEAVPLWARTADAKSIWAPSRPMPRGTAAMDLDSEPDNISSNVTLPSTPPGMIDPSSRPGVTPEPPLGILTEARPRAPATPRIPKGKVPVPSVKALETPRQPPPASSPPISVSNRITNVDFALQPAQNLRIEPIPLTDPKPQIVPKVRKQIVSQKQVEPQEEVLPSRSPVRKAKALRLSSGVKRGMLLCQAVPQRRSKTPYEPKRVGKSKQRHGIESLPDGSAKVILDDGDNVMQPIKPAKAGESTIKEKEQQESQSPLPVIEMTNFQPEASPEPSFGDFEDMEAIHGLMDQQLAVLPSPHRLQPTMPKSAPKQGEPSPKPAIAKKTANKRELAPEESPVECAPKVKKARVTAAKEQVYKPRARKKQTEKAHTVHEHSPPAMEPTAYSPTDIGPTAQTVGESPRNASASLPPAKLPLSTGGFRRNAQSIQPQQQFLPADFDAPTLCRETPVLSPHALRSSRSGPLMTTTELSAFLQKPQKPFNDPIDEDGIQQNASPNRGFRRSRSENDAPIPSTSEAWEAHNLPKAAVKSKGPTVSPARPKASALAALVKRTDPRRKFQRTHSLNVNTNLEGGGDEEQEVVSPPPLDDDVGPWSTEAFDLLGWRPPVRLGEDG